MNRLGSAALLLALLGACGADDADPAAFCTAVAELRAADPFAELVVADPEQMRDAFAELATDARRIARTAPEEARVQARRYESAVDELARELSGAGYDPRRLDDLRYGRATDEYADAAVALDNAATASCP